MFPVILLMQPGQVPDTKIYFRYESEYECMEGICSLFEEHLQTNHPDPIPPYAIRYHVSDLFAFLDQLADLACLIYNYPINAYAPYNKDEIKEKIYYHLLQGGVP